MATLRHIIITELKFLAFLPVKIDFAKHGKHFFALGFLSTWVAGVGRYWDHESAYWWQYLGLGSVVYIFVLGFVLWLITLPLGPKNWNYGRVVTFVGMTSPPAVLYAIPVEKYFTLDTAQSINAWFLAVVALWRMVLLVLFLKRAAALSVLKIIVATLLPVTLIVTTLTSLNLEHVVFRIMGGLAEREETGNDSAYIVLIIITYLSVLVSPFLLVTYLTLIVGRIRGYIGRKNPKKLKDSSDTDDTDAAA
jgi:hypothetical protein